jgi:hypothetical protein
MRVRRVSVSRGTAAELAEHPNGYVQNGLSIYTRRIAHARPINATGREKSKRAPLLLAELINKNEIELGSLQARLHFEVDSGRRAKILKNIGIKSKFLERLRAEHRT